MCNCESQSPPLQDKCQVRPAKGSQISVHPCCDFAVVKMQESTVKGRLLCQRHLLPCQAPALFWQYSTLESSLTTKNKDMNKAIQKNQTELFFPSPNTLPRTLREPLDPNTLSCAYAICPQESAHPHQSSKKYTLKYLFFGPQNQQKLERLVKTGE